MHAHLRTLHSSPLATVTDLCCVHREGEPPRAEYQSAFAVSFTRKGAFEYQRGREAASIYNGVVLLENAGSERTVSHYGSLRDECTSIEFSDELFHEAVPTGRFSASILRTTPRLDTLHWLLLSAGRTSFPGVTLRVDILVVELLHAIGSMISARKDAAPA